MAWTDHVQSRCKLEELNSCLHVICASDTCLCMERGAPTASSAAGMWPSTVPRLATSAARPLCCARSTHRWAIRSLAPRTSPQPGLKAVASCTMTFNPSVQLHAAFRIGPVGCRCSDGQARKLACSLPSVPPQSDSRRY